MLLKTGGTSGMPGMATKFGLLALVLGSDAAEERSDEDAS